MGAMVILEEKDVAASIAGLARRIVENNPRMDNVALVGIRTGGAFLAARLQRAIADLRGGAAPPLGVLDITLYRDDWTRIGPAPVVGKTELSFSLDDRTVILVDDVLFTGRTVRAAMDALIDFGRPRKIELAVLVDRGPDYRELPIMANYSGGIWRTGPDETINVFLKEGGERDHVTIDRKKTS